MHHPNPSKIAHWHQNRFDRIAAKRPELPEGTEKVEHGKFKIWVTPASQSYLKDTLDLLDWVDREYSTSGIPLGQGPIGVVLGARGGSTRSAYYSDMNVFWLVPKTLKGQTKATVIHEVAHWYHYNRLGVMNFEVLSKFSIALRLKKTLREESDMRKEISAEGAKIQALRDEIGSLETGGGRFRKGQVYALGGWDNPHTKDVPYTRNFKILSITAKKTRVQLLNPSTFEIARKLPVITEEPTNHVAWRFLTDEDKVRLTTLRKSLDEAVTGYNNLVRSDRVKGEIQQEHETRYEHQLNAWLPTEYAKKDVLEWWAELLTAYILHPSNTSPEVKSWISSVVA